MPDTARLDIAYQTIYEELLQRALDERFTSDYSPQGRFVAVQVKGRKYWYFDQPKIDSPGQARRYVGPVDDPEITKRVETFRDLKADVKRRRKLVSTLVREANLPRPISAIGQTIEALANAGFFRLRGVLVGTVAYQCYPAILGRHLVSSAMQTADADFAQFREISVAVEDTMPPILDVLRSADPSFRDIPHQSDGRLATQFTTNENLKVEFLVPHIGSDDQSGRPVMMPALGGAAAFPLRFLDYLIHQPMRAVLLHGSGIPILVPAPERYAIHKLIVGTRRREDREAVTKAVKDRLQACSIMEAMIANRQQSDLASALTDAWDRGEHWAAAIRTSFATFEDSLAGLLRDEIGKGIRQLGDDPDRYRF